MGELILDGIKYTAEFSKTTTGFCATWNCPVCGASGWTGLPDGTEQSLMQIVFDIVRKHHAEKHAENS